jgi:endoribonuclease Dicer
MYTSICRDSEKKVVFLANTIQLVKQQAESIRRNFEKIMADDELSNTLASKYTRVKWEPGEARLKVSCIHGEKLEETAGVTMRRRIEAELVKKKQIMEIMSKSTVIVMIAQMFLNCLRRGFIRLTDFSLMVFDECHHCKENHPYAAIMREFYFDRTISSSISR